MSISQQAKKVTGTVTDAKGEPLLGVNVVVKGTTNGTITDLDGKYSLEVEPNSILVVSYIGYVSQQIPASGEVVNVTLKEDTQNLDEVVVSRLRYAAEERYHRLRGSSRYEGPFGIFRIFRYPAVAR